MNIETKFNTVKGLAESIMSKNKETRNSDTTLYLEMCKAMGAKTIEDIAKINLNIVTVHKIRQVIQNKEGLYLPDENIKEIRKKRNITIREYMKRLNKKEEY